MEKNSATSSNDLSIVLCGEAGQGIQTIEQALTQILKKANFYFFATKEYMSRVRGGSNSTEIRVSNQKVSAFVTHIDILIALSPDAASHLQDRISANTFIIGPHKNFAKQAKFATFDFDSIATELGNKFYVSSVAIGFVLGFLKINSEFYIDDFKERFADKNAKDADIIGKNIEAAQRGYQAATEMLASGQIEHNISPNSGPFKDIVLNGADAMAFGAIAGGCNFISSYPMSPSTGVLTKLAFYSQYFDIVVEQAEDEIAAVNMALGAWYAGAKAMVTTSGGGFALMCEGLSLAGMTETPVVIHLGQRPGPATGLPTRTEQGDLNLALYAGHGEFPRILLAPGTLAQAFYLTEKSFALADKYQVPVILLSDQYLLDSYYATETLHPSSQIDPLQNIVKTSVNYKRYQLTETGISPRGIPGFGEGIVCVDSDEHTEEGYITEDFDIREKMVNKRLQKLELLKDEVVMPEFIGDENYSNLLVSWGSNYHNIKEALAVINNGDTAFLHFSQVYPLHNKIASYFTKAKKVIVIENNATGQFKKLLQQELRVNCDETILKYNGLPFSVEDLVDEITRRIR